jgi:hypothetical protein
MGQESQVDRSGIIDAKQDAPTHKPGDAEAATPKPVAGANPSNPPAPADAATPGQARDPDPHILLMAVLSPERVSPKAPPAPAQGERINLAVPPFRR